MHTWTPLFSKIVDSSLWVEPDWVVKVFLTMLAVKDADQIVRTNAFGLGRKCWPMDKNAEEKVLAALKILAAPDKRRLEPQPHEGRRIQKVEDGWLILNGQEYEDLMRTINRRAYKAAKEREYREQKNRPLKQKPNTSLPFEAAALRAQERGDLDTVDRLAATPKHGGNAA
jgi:hypothetical protein